MNGAQVGLAVAAGYVLGRFHKVKWAVAVAALGAGKRLPGIQGELLDRGKKLLSSTSASSTLTGEVRSHLVQAGKSAALTAVSNRIDSISDGLHERTETMRGDNEPGQSTDDQADDADEARADAEDADDADDAPDDEESTSRSTRQRAPRTRKSTGTDTGSRSSSGEQKSRSSAGSSGSGGSSGSRGSTGSSGIQAKGKTSSRAKKSTSSSQRSASSSSRGGS
ncbi:MAG TPA: hypothetical protein VGI74_17050 [Streptosporangiaceae bacterium]